VTRPHLLFALLCAAGCATTPVKRPAPTVTDTDLPKDGPGLIAYADAQITKDDPQAIEGSLVAIDHELQLVPNDYEGLWRGARACAWLADEYTDSGTRGQFADRGVKYAKQAIAANPQRVEGQYYLGLTQGLLATTKTLGGRELVPEVVKAAKAAAAIDEKFDHAGPLRLLGSVYSKAPPWPASVGDTDEGVKYLNKAVTIAGDFPQNHLLFGDALVADGKLPLGKKEYGILLAAPPAVPYAHRIVRWRKAANDGLQKIERKARVNSAGSASPF
jgi:hypothetical protein